VKLKHNPPPSFPLQSHAQLMMVFFARWSLLGCLFWIVNAQAGDTAQVSITGLTGELLSNVQAFLSLEQQKNHALLSAQRIRRLHQRAEDEIRQALQPFGYYQPKITATLQAPTAAGAPWQAQYRVEAGPALRLTQVELQLSGEAAQDPAFQAWQANYPLQVGQVLRHPPYDEAQQALLELARERGYFDAKLNRHELQIDEQAYQAEIHLAFDSGPRYRYSSVHFEQTTSAFDEAFLQSFLPFHSGDPYAFEQLTELRYALFDSNYFKEVEVNADLVKAKQGQVPVIIKLTPQKPNHYRIRAGFGTDTGLRLGVNWERRYLNRFGHQLDAGILGTQQRNRQVAKIRHIWPLNQHEKTYIETQLRYESKDLEPEDLGEGFTDLVEGDFQNTRASTASLQITKHHRRDWWGLDLDEALSLEYFVEQANYLAMFPPLWRDLLREELSALAPILETDYQLLIPGISWTYLHTDNRIYSRRGERVRLSLRGASESLLSNTWFWQTQLNARLIRSVGSQGRLLLRGDLGYSLAPALHDPSRADDPSSDAEVNQLPESLLFRTGGDNSVRGYQYETLNGEVLGLGARNLLVGSLEYEHRLRDKWSVATFVDVGNVFNDFNRLVWKTGAGVGVRWQSPVGMVRLDLACALNEPDKPFQIHFTIGPDFQ